VEVERKSKWRINWLIVATSLTVGYALLLLFVLLPAAQTCGASAASFFQKFLACRPPNELGDFLSGAFAPIAFLWLVAAVLIQAQELQAQRAELTLTREELAASREVMREQAEQARQQAIQAQRQADFIGEQTANLKTQAEDAHQEKQDRVFDEILRDLHKTFIFPLSSVGYKIATDTGTIIGNFRDLKNMTPEKAATEMKVALKALERSLEKANPSRGISLPWESIAALPDSLAKLIDMEESLSPSYRIKFNSLGLRESRASAQAIVEKKTD
jgi:hypothetical protein